MKNFIKTLPAIFAVALLMIAINVQAAPWTVPTASFPNDNALEPVNVGGYEQIKTGDLGVWELFAHIVKGERLRGQDWISTYQGGQGFCFGDWVGSTYDHDAGGCITSWNPTEVNLDPGGQNETLRFDGSSWLSNGILTNDGLTVSVNRLGAYSSGGGQNPGNPGNSGFLGIKKAYAQGSNDFTPLFQARSGQLDSDGNISGQTNGLFVLGNGITWTRGGFVSEGESTLIGDVMIGVQNLLNGDVISPANLYVSGETHLDRTVVAGGELFSGYDADFQWGGGSGDFYVGTTAEFEGGLQISGGNPEEGRVLTSDAEGFATWRDPAVQEGFSANVRIATGGTNHANSSASAWCDVPGEIMTGGGAQCEGGALLRHSRPESAIHWSARCQGDGVDVWAMCLSNGSAPVVPPTPPTTYEWNYSPSTFGGNYGLSCQDVLHNLGIWISDEDIATITPTPVGAPFQGYNTLPSGYQAGKCMYFQPSGVGFLINSELRDVTFSSQNWTPAINHDPFLVGLTYIRN